MNDHVKGLYEVRNKALTSIKGQLKRRGREVKSVPRNKMRSLVADFWMDGDLVKFKCTSNSQTSMIFEVMNNGNYGWLKRTKAKYFMYTIVADKVTYVVDIQSLKDYINNPKHGVAKTSKGALGEGESYSYIIPIDTLFDYNIIKEVINRK